MTESVSVDPNLVQLQFPFEWDGKKYDSIQLKRPKGKHLKGLPSEPTLDDLIRVAQKVTGIASPIWDEMDGADMMIVAEKIGDFLGSGRETGKR